MAACHLFFAAATFLLLISSACSQDYDFYPTNGTTDLPDSVSSPRYLLTATDSSVTSQWELAPLGPYLEVSRNDFIHTSIIASLFVMSSALDTAFIGGQIAYLSCEPASAGDVLNGVSPSQLFVDAIDYLSVGYVILYSTSSDHCQSVNLTGPSNIQGVLTIVGGPQLSAALLNLIEISLTVTIVPDLESYKADDSSGSAPTANTLQASASPTNSSPSSAPSDTENQHSTASSSQSGLIVGTTIGGLAGLLVFTLLLCFYIQRRKKTTARLSLPAVGTKSELEAGPTDQDVIGAVTPGSDLQDQNPARRATSPCEMLSENIFDTIENRGRQQKRRASYAEGISEPGDAVQADISLPARSQAASPVESGNEQASTDTSRSTTGVVSSATIQPSLDSYAAAEADFAVQELGLISMRKRTLAEQAAAAGRSPEEMGGRAEEQYKELVERESKLRRLLDDMQNGA